MLKGDTSLFVFNTTQLPALKISNQNNDSFWCKPTDTLMGLMKEMMDKF